MMSVIFFHRFYIQVIGKCIINVIQLLLYTVLFCSFLANYLDACF